MTASRNSSIKYVLEEGKYEQMNDEPFKVKFKSEFK